MIELINKRATISALGEEPHVWNDEEWELADRNRWRMDVAVIEDAPTIQTCEDSVSRQEAIDALRRDSKGKSSGYSSEDAIVTIGAVPTVQPERKKGKWLIANDIPSICSNCGANWIDDYVDSRELYFTGKIPNFCPNCGSDNRGEKE